mmetsp:Transcript_99787/g.280580  ORF Transcript_99787/g.280580 Transcript_99787/m.280580 type:complete len:209 (-) Transcript_99787:2-628(-)
MTSFSCRSASRSSSRVITFASNFSTCSCSLCDSSYKPAWCSVMGSAGIVAVGFACSAAALAVVIAGRVAEAVAVAAGLAAAAVAVGATEVGRAAETIAVGAATVGADATATGTAAAAAITGSALLTTVLDAAATGDGLTPRPATPVAALGLINADKATFPGARAAAFAMLPFTIVCALQQRRCRAGRYQDKGRRATIMSIRLKRTLGP